MPPKKHKEPKDPNDQKQKKQKEKKQEKEQDGALKPVRAHPDNSQQDQNVNDNKTTQKSGKVSQPFKCHCGKTYGSLAAVHTHINNKHQSQKKKYKQMIVNPKKIGQQTTTSIRMKDINYPEVEAELMCHADINLKAIYENYLEIARPGGVRQKEKEKDKGDKEKDILIDVTDDLSEDSDIGIEDELEGSEPKVSKRKQLVRNRVEDLKRSFKLQDVDQLINGVKELKTFKIQKFNLNLLNELSKFFVIEFAGEVQFSLELICALTKIESNNQRSHLRENIQMTLNNLWRQYPKIKLQLFSYYHQWIEIRQNFATWKSKQKKD